MSAGTPRTLPRSQVSTLASISMVFKTSWMFIFAMTLEPRPIPHTQTIFMFSASLYVVDLSIDLVGALTSLQELDAAIDAKELAQLGQHFQMIHVVYCAQCDDNAHGIVVLAAEIDGIGKPDQTQSCLLDTGRGPGMRKRQAGRNDYVGAQGLDGGDHLLRVVISRVPSLDKQVSCCRDGVPPGCGFVIQADALGLEDFVDHVGSCLILVRGHSRCCLVDCERSSVIAALLDVHLVKAAAFASVAQREEGAVAHAIPRVPKLASFGTNEVLRSARG